METPGLIHLPIASVAIIIVSAAWRRYGPLGKDARRALGTTLVFSATLGVLSVLDILGLLRKVHPEIVFFSIPAFLVVLLVLPIVALRFFIRAFLRTADRKAKVALAVCMLFPSALVIEDLTLATMAVMTLLRAGPR